MISYASEAKKDITDVFLNEQMRQIYSVTSVLAIWSNYSADDLILISLLICFDYLDKTRHSCTYVLKAS